MEGRTPKVSIGLPVHNGEAYIEDALDSILSQSYKDFELIIADNASTDRTREICLRYAKQDSRVRYHCNEVNIGAAPNHNLVFMMAKGEYFRWASYDDVIAPDFLARCVEVLDTHPSVVLCMTNTSRIGEHGEYLGPYACIPGVDAQNRIERFRNFALYNRSGNFVYGLIRANVLERTTLLGSFPSPDLVLLAELALYGNFYLLPASLFFRRSHPNQSTKGAMSRERARVLWMDPSLTTRALFPKWLSLFALLRAVRKAPIRPVERLNCYLCILHWIFIPRNFRGLLKDLIWAFIKGLGKLRPAASHKAVPQGMDN